MALRDSFGKLIVGAGKNILSALNRPKPKVKVDAPDLTLNYGTPPATTSIARAAVPKPEVPVIPPIEKLVLPPATQREIKEFILSKDPKTNFKTKEGKELISKYEADDARRRAEEVTFIEQRTKALEKEYARQQAEYEAYIADLNRPRTSAENFASTPRTEPRPDFSEPVRPNTTYLTEDEANIAEQLYTQELFNAAKARNNMTSEQILMDSAKIKPEGIITPESLTSVVTKKPNSALKTIGTGIGFGALSAVPGVTENVTDNTYANKAADAVGLIGNLGLAKTFVGANLPGIVKLPAALLSLYPAFGNIGSLFSSTPTKEKVTTKPDNTLVEEGTPEGTGTGSTGGTGTVAGTPETAAWAYDQNGNKVYVTPKGTGTTAGTAGTQTPIVTTQEAAVDALIKQSIDEQVSAITGGVTQKDVDDATTKQLNDLIKQYGDINKMYDSLVTGDPALEANLASIENQYKSSSAIISNAYDVATKQITGSTEAFSNQMKSAGEAQMAANALAAGGLSATVAPTGLTGEQANAAGISDTAVGGAAITGSALVSALGGVGQSQQIADQLQLGSQSTDSLQQVALDKAYAQTVLEQNKLDAVTTAQLNDIKTRAEQKKTATIYKANNLTNLADKVYATKAAQAAAKKQQAVDIAKIKADAASTKAKYLLAMSKDEYQAFTGIKANSNLNPNPSFVVAKPLVGKDAKGKITKDPSAVIDVSYVNKNGDPVKLTVAQANTIIASVNASLQDPQALSPDTALKYWTIFYKENQSTPGFIDVLNKMKYPVSPQAMVNALYPAK